MQMTESIARAAAQDAGNRSMKAAGRKAWSREDWSIAWAEFDRLWPHLSPMFNVAK